MKCGRFPRLIMPRAAGLSGPFFQPTQIAACIKGVGNFLGVGKPGDVYFDFTKGFLDHRLTYARNDTVGTYFDSAGVLQTASANQPRFDYDPDTLEPLGILIEESRTNLVTYSSVAGYTLVAGTATRGAAVASPDGNTNADRISGATGSAWGGSLAYRIVTGLTSSATYTWSVYIKSAGSTTVKCTARDASTGGVVHSAVTDLTDGAWHRISVTHTLGAATTSAAYLVGSTDGDIDVCFFSCELGSFATSYIPNPAAGTSTRQADVLSCTGSNFSSWYRQDQGTILTVSRTNAGISTTALVFAMLTDSSNRTGQVYYDPAVSTAMKTYIQNPTFTRTLTANGGLFASDFSKHAFAYKTASHASCVNGGTVATDSTAGDIAVSNQLGIGRYPVSGSGYLNGHIKSLKYWRQRIPNAALQQLTSWTYVAPEEEFDFLNETLDPLLTYARADTVGTRFNSSGVLETLSANQPRFDYDPYTLEPLGILIEESRTNLTKSCRDLRAVADANPIAFWGYIDCTVAVNQTGIDGADNVCSTVTEGSVGNAQKYSSAMTVAAGSTVTASFYLKKGNLQWLRAMVGGGGTTDGAEVWIDLTNKVLGTAQARGAGTAVSASIKPLANGFVRVTLTCLPNGSYTSAYVYLISAAANQSNTRVSGATYIVDYAQLEVGAFATSPILTTTAAAQRQADALSCTGTNFSSWYRQDAGTFLADAVPGLTPSASQWLPIVTVSDGTVNNRLYSYYINMNSNNFRIDTGGVQQTTCYVQDASPLKRACAYAANNVSQAVDGVLSTTDTSASLPVVDRLYIGAGATGVPMSVRVKSFRYWRQRLPDAALQVLTS